MSVNQINPLLRDPMVYNVFTSLTPYKIYECSLVCKEWYKFIAESPLLKTLHGVFWVNKSIIFYKSIENQLLKSKMGEELFRVIFKINTNKAREFLFNFSVNIQIQNFLQLIPTQAIDHFDKFTNIASQFKPKSKERDQAFAAIIKHVAPSGISGDDIISSINSVYYKAHARLSVCQAQALQNPQYAEQFLPWAKGVNSIANEEKCKLWMKIAKTELLLGKNQEALKSFAFAYGCTPTKVEDKALLQFRLIVKGYHLRIDISSYLERLKKEWSGPRKNAKVSYEILTKIARFEFQCYKNHSLAMQTIACVKDPELSLKAKLQLIEEIAKLDHRQAIIYLSSIEQDALQSGYYTVYLDCVAALIQIARSITKSAISNAEKQYQAGNCLVKAKQIIADKINTSCETVKAIPFLGKIAALQSKLKLSKDASTTSDLAKSFLDKLDKSQLFSARTYLLQYETDPEEAKGLLGKLEAQIEGNIQIAFSASPLTSWEDKNEALKAIILENLTVARTLLRLSPYEESI